MKWGLNVSLKYLTPSAALRDSWLRSPLYSSASPTSLFFSAGPRFSVSSTVRSNQSSIKCSYLQQVVDPSRRGGDSTACYIQICGLCAICSNHRFGRFFFVSAGKSSRSSSQSFIIDIVENLKPYPPTQDPVHYKILFFSS